MGQRDIRGQSVQEEESDEVFCKTSCTSPWQLLHIPLSASGQYLVLQDGTHTSRPIIVLFLSSRMMPLQLPFMKAKDGFISENRLMALWKMFSFHYSLLPGRSLQESINELLVAMLDVSNTVLQHSTEVADSTF